MWSISKALQIPLDKRIEVLGETPYTISFVIRKRQQLDGLYELPKEKRPPDSLIWDSPSEELDKWLDNVFNKTPVETNVILNEDEIER